MDADGLKALFEPFGAVAGKRMFSGHGVYADGLCFVYTNPKGNTVKMPFWRLPAEAYDDEDALRRWGLLALEAARRSALAQPKPKPTPKSKSRKAAKGRA